MEKEIKEDYLVEAERKRKEQKEKETRINNMENEEFDKYMVNKYPLIFQDRRKPMNETCMCWGFNAGKGWNYLLDELCEKLDKLYKLTGILTIADQVKEKFGGLRFYVHLHSDKPDEEMSFVSDVIYDVIGKAEGKSYHTCACCGEDYGHDQIYTGSWVYDLCEKCFVKEHPDRKEAMEEFFKANEFIEEAKGLLYDEFRKEDSNIVKAIKEEIEKRKNK